MSSKTFEGKIKAGAELQHALKSILAIAENYPQLRANENFLQLQQELAAIEELRLVRILGRFYPFLDSLRRERDAIDVARLVLDEGVA